MIPESVTVILITTDNEFVLQKRDDRPDVIQAGKIGNFGGGLETGELPVDGAIREIREELGITLRPEKLSLIGSFTIDNESENRLPGKEIKHLFVSSGINKTDLPGLPFEGEAILFVSTEGSLENLPLADGAKKALEYFKQNYHKQLT